MTEPTTTKVRSAQPHAPTAARGRLVVSATHAVELLHEILGFLVARGAHVLDTQWTYTDDTRRDRTVCRVAFGLDELEAILPRLRSDFSDEVAQRYGMEFRIVPES